MTPRETMPGKKKRAMKRSQPRLALAAALSLHVPPVPSWYCCGFNYKWGAELFLKASLWGAHIRVLTTLTYKSWPTLESSLVQHFTGRAGPVLAAPQAHSTKGACPVLHVWSCCLLGFHFSWAPSQPLLSEAHSVPGAWPSYLGLGKTPGG